jgi:2,3-diaminopropionate biosynthesis protein SbnB
MRDGNIVIINGHEVKSALNGREAEVIDAVRRAYVAHAKGHTSLPHSTFLRFPDQPQNRIIALAGFLGEGVDVAGIKWIASFPDNVKTNIDRASAVLVLNSTSTGRPEAIIEGSLISAQRTAASAALAASVLHGTSTVTHAGVIGCGLINFEVVKFLKVVYPALERLTVFDLDVGRAEGFAERCSQLFKGLKTTIVGDTEEVLRSASLISIATSALESHISDLTPCAAGTTILHISLRDLTPVTIMTADNVVDDPDHVCRANTSVHLVEQTLGHRRFIRCTLADVLMGVAPPRQNKNDLVVFSPFGLGILDLAVGALVRRLCAEDNRGMVLESFFPEPWAEFELSNR